MYCLSFIKTTQSSFSNQHFNFRRGFFYLIHINVWGPYRIPLVTGAMFMITIIDDCSRYTWTYMIVSKTQVSSVLLHFFTMITTQFQKNTKKIRTDNGTEFLNKKCMNCSQKEESFIKNHVYTALNRTTLQKESTDISYKLQDQSCFKQTFLSNFGQKHSSQQLI